MTILHMDIEEVRGLSNRISRVASSLDDNMLTVRRAKSRLTWAWIGGDSNNFQDEINLWLHHYEQLLDDLQYLAIRIAREADEWEITDSAFSGEPWHSRVGISNGDIETHHTSDFNNIPWPLPDHPSLWEPGWNRWPDEIPGWPRRTIDPVPIFPLPNPVLPIRPTPVFPVPNPVLPIHPGPRLNPVPAFPWPEPVLPSRPSPVPSWPGLHLPETLSWFSQLPDFYFGE